MTSATFVKLRAGTAHLWRLGPTWKVTARYLLDDGGEKPVPCVRVRCGVGPVMHFTAKRFAELFEPDETRG